MCEHHASFREGYLPSESAQHATKQKNHLKSHLHPDSASFELANALSEPTTDRSSPEYDDMLSSQRLAWIEGRWLPLYLLIKDWTTRHGLRNGLQGIEESTSHYAAYSYQGISSVFLFSMKRSSSIGNGCLQNSFGNGNAMVKSNSVWQ